MRLIARVAAANQSAGLSSSSEQTPPGQEGVAGGLLPVAEAYAYLEACAETADRE